MNDSLTRRTFLGCTAGAIGALAAASPVEELAKNRPPLVASAFYRLPLTSVKPGGWLKDQLRIQADGITGHLGEFWPDVGPNSAWLGGTGEGWERGPYYLDGLLPLAYLLDDPKLIAKVKPWVDWTLDRQRSDGSIGPEKNQDWWPIMIMLKVLTQYQEATGDSRVIPVMERYFAYQSRMLATEPLKSWAIYRWGDELASLLWLYNRNGDAKLLGLAQQLKAQGFDWRRFYENFPFSGRIAPGRSGHESHGVNNAMGLKTAALWYLISHDPADQSATELMLSVQDKFEGLPNGMFSADEHFAGRNPSQGIELCAVVEMMFSLELGLAVLGDARLGDRLEKLAFNPLPGAQTADQWSHQYDQQPNQAMVSLGRRDWTTNGPESNLFGLAPNYGCCTANLHQGWPKFTASLWMASADDGLAVAAYAPSEVHTKIKGVDVVSVSVERGPLVYSLRIGEAWSKLKQTGPVADWEVYPTSPWNYGLRVDLKNPSASFQVREEPLTRQPFNNSSPPVMLEAKARRLPQWVIVDDSAAPPPQGPLTSQLEDETVTLFPYGAARLRITSFPVLGPDQPPRKGE